MESGETFILEMATHQAGDYYDGMIKVRSWALRQASRLTASWPPCKSGLPVVVARKPIRDLHNSPEACTYTPIVGYTPRLLHRSSNSGAQHTCLMGLYCAHGPCIVHGQSVTPLRMYLMPVAIVRTQGDAGLEDIYR